jgi:ketosteroid isomerase-like protein
VIDLYTDNAVYMTPDGGIDRGRAHITGTFERFFTSIKQRGGTMSIAFQIVDRRVSGDMAYDVGIFTLAVNGPDGKPRVSKGKFVVIAVKQGKDWKFQLDSYSDLPKPRGEAGRS